MTKIVGILNLNYGNINSILRTLKNLHIKFKLVSSKEDLKNVKNMGGKSLFRVQTI